MRISFEWLDTRVLGVYCTSTRKDVDKTTHTHVMNVTFTDANTKAHRNSISFDTEDTAYKMSDCKSVFINKAGKELKFHESKHSRFMYTMARIDHWTHVVTMVALTVSDKGQVNIMPKFEFVFKVIPMYDCIGEYHYRSLCKETVSRSNALDLKNLIMRKLELRGLDIDTKVSVNIIPNMKTDYGVVLCHAGDLKIEFPTYKERSTGWVVPKEYGVMSLGTSAMEYTTWDPKLRWDRELKTFFYDRQQSYRFVTIRQNNFMPNDGVAFNDLLHDYMVSHNEDLKVPARNPFSDM